MKELSEYTHSTAVRGSGLTSREIQQWRQRQLFPDLGEMHVTGRYVYSRREVIQLRMVAEIVRTLNTPPSLAVDLAGALIKDLTDDQLAPGHIRRLITWIFRLPDTDESQNRHGFETYYADEFWPVVAKLKLQHVQSAFLIMLSDLIDTVDRALASTD